MRKRKFTENRDSNGNPIKIPAKDFITKKIDPCIQNGDPECTFYLGQEYDLTIVMQL